MAKDTGKELNTLDDAQIVTRRQAFGLAAAAIGASFIVSSTASASKDTSDETNYDEAADEDTAANVDTANETNHDVTDDEDTAANEDTSTETNHDPAADEDTS